MKKQSRQILGLDLLRAAAAYMVMLFHYTFWNWAHNPDLISRWPAVYKTMAPYTSGGWVGVDIFFVISGFIITYSIGNIGPADFVRHRITRLLPSALICATISAGCYLWVRYIPLRTVAWLWLRSITFWPLRPWIDGSYWTLPVEISFYFLVFLCLSTRRTLLPWVMAMLGATSSVWNAVLNPAHQFNLIFLLVHGCFFAFGVFLYESVHRGLTPLRAFALAMSLPGCVAEVWNHNNSMSNVFWSVGMCFLVASVLLNEPALRLVGPGGASIIRKIGLMTYPLYLVHDQVGNLLIEWLHTTARVSYGWALVVTMTGMTALAVAIVQLGEPQVKRVILMLYPERFQGVRPGTPAGVPYIDASRST